MASTRRERLRIFAANYGRDFGWFVEKGGRRLVALSEPRFEDMFWHSYAVEPLADDEAGREAVFSKAFWDRTDLVFRNRETGEVAKNAFPGGAAPTPSHARIAMRGLYTALQPTTLERALLWLARRRAR